jgi:hypothetical protein
LEQLLLSAIAAHGGLKRWNDLESLQANVSIGGAHWDLVGLPGVFENAHLEVKLSYEQVILHLVDDDERLIFTPNQVSLESKTGQTIDSRVDPRSAFARKSANSTWDKLDAGYFAGYALWGYLTTPFLYTYPGFEAREVEPWTEDGERWRVLQVKFPDGYAAHTSTQLVYFGEDGLVRRHLYTVDILGGARGTNYASDYREADGIRIATRRRIIGYNEARQKIDEPVLVSIDLSEVHFR